ncbi:hypothetical protein B0I08_10378 [Glaciihabitans tibetensis]|uniref:Glycosyltransferase involved in cell wall biosynthesis n=1 Tax=Glaciihabitans tibetensis TaxID=1266600 RepID=A0A2T0VFA4_9MICO|nr:DUF6716 putative glycosyltransferase [Glaciihabitans tibetensis]PRY68873.1 hypothetical protein B0I08_10378 [Glaciihabitans tibetensis]
MRVLAIGDSDSYVKWGAAVLERMPAHWEKSMVIIGTPVVPSGAQLEAALSSSSLAVDDVPIVELADVTARVLADKPDIVLMSVRGPVVRVLVRTIVAATALNPELHRPVFVSGLPGISIPATGRALYFRSQVDLFLLHSKREIREFQALAHKMNVTQSFALATLPFLPTSGTALATGDPARTDIVFAAQAKVPREKEDRRAVLNWLIAAARARPTQRVVIKLRALPGEAQTHAEKYPFDQLLREAAKESPLPTNLVVSGGSMQEHLDSAAGLVTVSSTAAIEAAAQGIPVLALDDFGTSAELINLVFEGSGLLGHSRELTSGALRLPRPSWLDDNYFHPESDETWVTAMEELVAQNAAQPIPLRPQFRARYGGAPRHAWDRKLALGPYDHTKTGALAYAVGYPLRAVVIWARTPLRAARRRKRLAAVAAAQAARVASTS